MVWERAFWKSNVILGLADLTLIVRPAPLALSFVGWHRICAISIVKVELSSEMSVLKEIASAVAILFTLIPTFFSSRNRRVQN